MKLINGLIINSSNNNNRYNRNNMINKQQNNRINSKVVIKIKIFRIYSRIYMKITSN